MSTHTQTRVPPTAPGDAQEHRSRFEDDAYGYLDELAAEVGSAFVLQLGAVGGEGQSGYEHNGDWLFLCTPELVQEMYGAETQAEAVSGAAANAIFFGTREKSVAYIDGEAHRRRRSQILPMFSSVSDYSDLITRTTLRHLRTWPRGEEIELFPLLQRLTIDIIVEVVCGDFPEDAKDRIRQILPLTETARVPRPTLLDADRRVRSVIQEVLAARRSSPNLPGRGDASVAARLIALAAEGDESLTDEVLRDEVFSLLYTGFSTTANTLSWILARIDTEPDVRSRLDAELREVNGGLHGAVRDGEVPDTGPYLDAVISETLRVHPVTPLNGVRLLLRDATIGDLDVRAGTVLVHCAHVLQRDDAVFDEALTFRPERFLDNPPRPYAWGAFGGGRRTCVGKTYSRAEMSTILGVLLPRVEVRLSAGLPAPRQQGFFLAPEDWLRCRVIDRT